MTDRERWILYPLLFLAVGLGLRNGIVSEARMQEGVIDANIIRANTIFVYGAARTADRKPVVAIGSGNEGRTGLVETFTGEGQRQAMLGSGPTGGLLTLFDVRERIAMVTGHEGRFIGQAVGRFDGSEFIPVVTLPLVAARRAGQTTGGEPAETTNEDQEKEEPQQPSKEPLESSKGQEPKSDDAAATTTDENAK